jgi:hypothetical protein
MRVRIGISEPPEMLLGREDEGTVIGEVLEYESDEKRLVVLAPTSTRLKGRAVTRLTLSPRYRGDSFLQLSESPVIVAGEAYSEERPSWWQVYRRPIRFVGSVHAVKAP